MEYTKSEQKQYEKEINDIFTKRLKNAKDKYGEDIGDHLAEVFTSGREEVLKKVINRAIKKNLNEHAIQEITRLIENRIITFEDMRNLSASITNSLRSLAGNRFTSWVCILLNNYFTKYKIPIIAVTLGKEKNNLAKKLVTKNKDGTSTDFKPDIDILIYRKTDLKDLLIISCKSTTRERVTQTIRWKENMAQLSPELRDLKIFLVTGWQDYKSVTLINRVSILDGVYSTHKDIKEVGNIKHFNKIYEDIVAIYRAQLNS
jgi:hypothetical protein